MIYQCCLQKCTLKKREEAVSCFSQIIHHREMSKLQRRYFKDMKKAKKSAISLVFILAMLVMFLPSGAGSMIAQAAGGDFTIVDGVLTKYNGSGGDVVIPDGVTGIGEEAFEACISLTSVTIPNSVTSIGEKTFSDCTSLTSVTIPNSVTSIGWGAFEYCSSLTSVTIPNSVTSIGESAFEYCSSLTSVTIPSSVTKMGLDAFDNRYMSHIYYSG